MTTELEKEFFKVFGVEPKQLKICRNINHCPNKYKICNDKCKNWRVIREVYPEITDRKLLQMICILNDYEGIDVKGNKIEELKEELLKQCIEYFKYPIAFEENNDLCNLHNHIQQLFKEGE